MCVYYLLSGNISWNWVSKYMSVLSHEAYARHSVLLILWFACWETPMQRNLILMYNVKLMRVNFMPRKFSSVRKNKKWNYCMLAHVLICLFESMWMGICTKCRIIYISTGLMSSLIDFQMSLPLNRKLKGKSDGYWNSSLLELEWLLVTSSSHIWVVEFVLHLNFLLFSSEISGLYHFSSKF